MYFPVWLRNRLIFARSETVFSRTEKPYIRITDNFSWILKLPNKIGFNLIIFHFNIRRKLSIIRRDKLLLTKENICIYPTVFSPSICGGLCPSFSIIITYCQIFNIHQIPHIYVRKVIKFVKVHWKVCLFNYFKLMSYG